MNSDRDRKDFIVSDEKKPQTRDKLLAEVLGDLNMIDGLNQLRKPETRADEYLLRDVRKARDKLDAALRSELRSATHEELAHIVLDYAQQHETVSEALALHVASLLPKLMEHEVICKAIREDASIRCLACGWKGPRWREECANCESEEWEPA